MAGRFDTGERIVDVAPKPLNEVPNKKRKIGLFRRLVLTLLLSFLGLSFLVLWDAFKAYLSSGNPFLWEVGYAAGALQPFPLVGSLAIGWFLIPFAFSPDK